MKLTRRTLLGGVATFGLASTVTGTGTTATYTDTEQQSVSATAFTEVCELGEFTIEFDDDGEDVKKDDVLEPDSEGQYRIHVTGVKHKSEPSEGSADDTDQRSNDADGADDDEKSDDKSDTEDEADDETDEADSVDNEDAKELIGILFALETSDGDSPSEAEITKVEVKGGPSRNVYEFNGVTESTSEHIESPEGGDAPDTNFLYAPENNGGQRPAISNLTVHYEVCD